MLLRAAVRMDLNVVMPARGHYHWGPEEDLAGTEWEEAGMEYDLFALHTTWNHEGVQKLLGDDTTMTPSRQCNAV